jgi:aminoglycoside/choline kinase family phosphotransferase
LGLNVKEEEYYRAWQEVWAEILRIAENNPVLVLRDFHADNLMVLPDRDDLGLLDFQDALAGHPAYDLASVLEDARRDVPPALEQAMLDRYVAATGHGASFERAYWSLAAQRNTRILGVFTRLWKRDNKPGYRRFQPRMWGLLERDLQHPALAPVSAWFDTNVRAEHRAAPWSEMA